MSGGERENFSAHYSAEEYDHFSGRFLAQFDRLLEGRVLQEFHKRPAGRRLLDVGCGTSRFLLRLAAQPALGALHFFALDYFAEMTVLSRSNCAREGLLERIDTVQGDVHHLPFASACLDFVISRSTLHHWADPVAALVDIRRVLAPGGVALIHEIRRDPDPAALAIFNQRRAEAGIEHSRLDEKYTLQEVREFVAQAGLERDSTLMAPSQGLSSLGCEIRIQAS